MKGHSLFASSLIGDTTVGPAATLVAETFNIPDQLLNVTANRT